MADRAAFRPDQSQNATEKSTGKGRRDRDATLAQDGSTINVNFADSKFIAPGKTFADAVPTADVQFAD